MEGRYTTKEGDLEIGMTVVVRRVPQGWNRLSCGTCSALIAVVGMVTFLGASAPGPLGELARGLGIPASKELLRRGTEVPWVYFGLVVALAFLLPFTLGRCLRNRAAGDGKNKVLISDEGIQKTAVHPILSYISDPRGAGSFLSGGQTWSSTPRWQARRGEIERLVVAANRTLGQTTLSVYFANRGRAWLFPLEDWIPAHHHHGSERDVHDAPRLKGRATLQALRGLPLVQALLAHHYHVEFYRVGFFGLKPIGSE